jgi:hypothetical protein
LARQVKPFGNREPFKIAKPRKPREYVKQGSKRLNLILFICRGCDTVYDTGDDDKPLPGMPRLGFTKKGKCRDCRKG